MIYRRATLDDCPLLAELNHQLIQDSRLKSFHETHDSLRAPLLRAQISV